METPKIPSNNDPEFRDALSALVQAASVMRQVLLMVTAAKIDPERLMFEHAEVILTADKVIDTWRDHMGIKE